MRDINTTGTTYVLVEGLPCTQLLVIACLPLHSRTVALKFQSNCFLQWRRAVWYSHEVAFQPRINAESFTLPSCTAVLGAGTEITPYNSYTLNYR